MKNLRRIIAIFVVGGATAASVVGTLAQSSVPKADKVGSQSVRLGSEQHQRGAFFPAYYRTHRGGGLRGGK